MIHQNAIHYLRHDRHRIPILYIRHYFLQLEILYFCNTLGSLICKSCELDHCYVAVSLCRLDIRCISISNSMSKFCAKSSNKKLSFNLTISNLLTNNNTYSPSMSQVEHYCMRTIFLSICSIIIIADQWWLKVFSDYRFLSLKGWTVCLKFKMFAAFINYKQNYVLHEV